jgi:hypothetical protein
LTPDCVSALDVEGVEVPEVAVFGSEDVQLVLNGAGVRKKFFIKVYVGALYLPKRLRNAAEILSLTGEKRVTMHFVHSKVSAEKMMDGWTNGFSANHSAEEMEELQERLDKFNTMFPTLHKGGMVRLDFIPSEGTQVWINNQMVGIIKGADFNRALLKVWLGEHPVDTDLKKGMLGE